MIKLLSIADIISITNALLGFISIIMLFLNEIYFSFSFILLALLADGLDGVVARKTIHSNLGLFMEAMADMISLGIAPAAFIFKNYYSNIAENTYQNLLLIIVLIIFLSFSMIRLASFHILNEEKYFIGLPASVSTIILLIPTYFNANLFYIIPIIFIVSFAMISNVHYPKLSFKIDIIAVIFIILTIIVGKNYSGVIPIILLILILIYVIVGPFYILNKN